MRYNHPGFQKQAHTVAQNGGGRIAGISRKAAISLRKENQARADNGGPFFAKCRRFDLSTAGRLAVIS